MLMRLITARLYTGVTETTACLVRATLNQEGLAKGAFAKQLELLIGLMLNWPGLLADLLRLLVL